MHFLSVKNYLKITFCNERLIYYLRNFQKIHHYNMSTQSSMKILKDDFRSSNQTQSESLSNTNEEWLNAKKFHEIPGPSKWMFPLSFLPGGKMHGMTLIDMHKIFYEEYGQIVRIPGNFGQPDTVLTFNADDIEKVYRTEGIWPIRIGLETFAYYRKVLRPNIFKNLGGLVTEQGESWANIRSKVNPVLMKPQTVKHHLPEIDEIATEFIERISEIRDPITNKVPDNFNEEINKWAFESISVISLNKRLGLITSNKSDPIVEKFVAAMKRFFQLSYEFDVLPSFWKYYETAKFKKLISTYDDITEITTKYIEDAIQNSNNNSNNSSKGVVDQLLKIDRQVAIVMAMDMLMAGIDTTSSALISLLYRLAKNPDKQEKLRNELLKIMPNKNTKLTVENTKNLPYLRACIKESLRLVPITPGNFRLTGQDLVLSGYQVPKGIGVLMGVMILSNDERFFLKSDQFIPERWLKNNKNDCPHLKSNHPFVYLPFGFGSRTCIGKRIAEMEIETLISKIIRNYNVSWYDEELNYTSNLIIIPISKLNFKFENIEK